MKNKYELTLDQEWLIFNIVDDTINNYHNRIFINTIFKNFLMSIYLWNEKMKKWKNEKILQVARQNKFYFWFMDFPKKRPFPIFGFSQEKTFI